MAALPRPASLEKMPRAMPNWIAIMTAVPANPPTAAWPVKADSMIRAKAPGTSVMFIRMTINAHPT